MNLGGGQRVQKTCRAIYLGSGCQGRSDFLLDGGEIQPREPGLPDTNALSVKCPQLVRQMVMPVLECGITH